MTLEINEAFGRIIRGHLLLIVTLTVLPLVIMAAFTGRGPLAYSATARIQASNHTIGSDVEADSVLNRVIGVATSESMVSQALAAANIADRNALTVGQHEVSVVRLGSSPVMNLTVTDPNPTVAQSLATALADTVVKFLSGEAAQQTGDLVAKLTAQQKDLYSQRQNLIDQLDRAGGSPGTASLSAQLSTVDQQLGDLTTTLRQLEINSATDASARVISSASPPMHVRSNATTKIVLAGAAGLVASLLVASLIEVARPRLAGARAFARELGVPVLGRLRRPRSERYSHSRRLLWWWLQRWLGLRDRPVRAPGVPLTAESTLAVRRAAAVADLHTLALIADTSAADQDAVALSLTTQLAAVPTASAPQNGRVLANATLLMSFPEPVRAGKAQAIGNPHASPHARAGKVGVPNLPGPVVQTALRVLPLTRIGQTDPLGRCGLIVAVAALPRLALLRRVEDLAQATGWPVIGVFDDSHRSRRR